MELGTEDIFLENNRKPSGVVQRFGNEMHGGDAKAFSSALAAGMSAINTSSNRRAIVKVRAVVEDDDNRRRPSRQASRRGASMQHRQGSAASPTLLSEEGLENKLHLGHLRLLAPFFIIPPNPGSPLSPRSASSTSVSQVDAGGDAGFAQALSLLQRDCEHQLWLHGPPPPVPVGTIAQSQRIATATSSKALPQFSHIRSHVAATTASARHMQETRSLEEIHARQVLPNRLTATMSPSSLATGDAGGSGQTSSGDDDEDDDDVGPAAQRNAVRRGAARASTVPTHLHQHHSRGAASRNDTKKSEQVRSLMDQLFSRPKRSLNEAQFTHAILNSNVAMATAASAQQLFRKIDVESSGEITWDAFVTFLVSQSGEGGGNINPAISQSTEFVPTSIPRSCPSWYQHERLICCLVVNHKTGTVFTGGCDGALRSWDAATLRHQKLWYTCSSWINGIALTFREQRLVLCTVDRQIVVFDAKSGDVLRLYRGRRVLETENGISFAHESIPTVTVGGKVISHAAPKDVKIRRMRSDDRSSARSGGGGDGAGSGTSGAMSFEQYRALLEEEKNNQLERRKLEEYILAGLMESPTCLEYHYSHHDEDVLFFGMDDGSIRLYIIPPTQQRLLRQHFKLRPHTARVRKMCVVPALEGLLSCSDDGTLKLTNLTTGQLMKTYNCEAHTSGVTCFAYSPVMKLFVSTGGERHGLVWDQLQETPVAHLDEHACPTLACCVNEVEWQFITVGMDNSVMVFNARTYKLQQQFHERVRSNGQFLSTTTSGAPATGAAPATNASTPTAALASTSNHHLYSVAWFDGPRQRLLLATTFPVMHQLRRNVATLPAHYCGHTAPVVAVLYNHVFDVALTIDAEHLVLGWRVLTGEASGLSFKINSFASPHDDLRLTASGFDVMQRRLITGFQTGTVVVWNVFNGQALCVIKASPPPLPLPLPGSTGDHHHHHAHHAKAGDGGGGNAGGGDAAAATPEVVGAPAAGCEVVAVAALQRESTHFVFSVGQCLVTLPETPLFTVANPPRWYVPTHLGVVTCLCQCTPVLVACGTSSGALLLFNVLAEKDDGQPLWDDGGVVGQETNLGWTTLTQPTPTNKGTKTATAACSKATPIPTLAGGPSPRPPPSPHRGAGAQSHHHGGARTTTPSMQDSFASLARVVAVFPLTQLQGRTLLVAHSDGKAVLWHVEHRRCMGTFQLAAHLIDNGSGGGGAAGGINIVNVAMDKDEQLLAHADDSGNIAVVRIVYSPITTAPTTPATSEWSANPSASLVGFASVPESQSPLSRTGHRGGSGGSSVRDDAEQHQQQCQQPALPTSIARMEPMAHFYGRTPSLTSLAVVRSAVGGRSNKGSRGDSSPGGAGGLSSPFVGAARGGGGRARLATLQPDAMTMDESTSLAASIPFGGGDDDASSPPCMPLDPSALGGTSLEGTQSFRSTTMHRTPSTAVLLSSITVVTTSTDFFTRVFDLHGHLVGELGMHRWHIAKPETFYMPTRVLSPMLSALDLGGGGGGGGMPPGGDSIFSQLSAPPHQHHPPPSNTGSTITPTRSPLKGPHPPPGAQRTSGFGGIDDRSGVGGGGTSRRGEQRVSDAGGGGGYTLPPAIAATPSPPLGVDGGSPRESPQSSSLSHTPPQASIRRPLQQVFVPSQPPPSSRGGGGGGGAMRPTSVLLGGNASGKVRTHRQGVVKEVPLFPEDRCMSFSSEYDASPSQVLQGCSMASGGGGSTRGGMQQQLSLSPPRGAAGHAPAPETPLGARAGGGGVLASGGTQLLGAGTNLSGWRRSSIATSGCSEMTSVVGGKPPPTPGNASSVIMGSSFLGGGGRSESGVVHAQHDVPGGAVGPTPTFDEATTASRTRLLTGHLDHQLNKLRACKPDLNEELKRIETRLRTSKSHAPASDTTPGGPDALGKSSWTSRVAARLELHDLDDIQPPAGSRASNEAGRRTNNRIRLMAGGGGGASRGGQRAAEFFPSVTAPGTIVIGVTNAEGDGEGVDGGSA